MTVLFCRCKAWPSPIPKDIFFNINFMDNVTTAFVDYIALVCFSHNDRQPLYTALFAQNIEAGNQIRGCFCSSAFR